jgi:two-component system, chemotaxis family, protein-glutamate methylesterase/glutaminase
LQNKIRVLVVDDSGYVIASITRRLESDPGIEVIGSARNGIEAVDMVKTFHPDVVTLDIVMPEMDGLAALEKIMADCPTPVVMLSALTGEHSISTIKALELGAVDFFLKPSAIRPAGEGYQDDTLVAKVKAAATAHVFRKERSGLTSSPVKKKIAAKNAGFSKLVVIGTSTGGPRSLMEVVPLIPADIPAAFLIVQHMPPTFTRTLAERLNQASQIEIAEARDGNTIRRGLALLAPGDFHMTVDSKGKISLNQEPTYLGVRPAVDITMKSAAEAFRDIVIGVVLTGMGTDGTIGSNVIKSHGGKVLAQDEATSAVFGMPMSVFKSGCVDRVLPLHKMADAIVEACLQGVAHE